MKDRKEEISKKKSPRGRRTSAAHNGDNLRQNSRPSSVPGGRKKERLEEAARDAAAPPNRKTEEHLLFEDSLIDLIMVEDVAPFRSYRARLETLFNPNKRMIVEIKVKKEG